MRRLPVIDALLDRYGPTVATFVILIPIAAVLVGLILLIDKIASLL